MNVRHNPQEVKRLLRVLDTLNEFELVVVGYQSLALFREMKEMLRINCRVRKIDVFDIDVSSLSQVGEFEKLLPKKAVKGKRYRVFNIVGLESQVKIGKASIFLNHLNLIRDRLAADFNYGFFFWLPEILVKRFTLDAPDLWAWRNTVLVFEDEERRGELEFIPGKTRDKKDFENFTLKEKQRQIEYLQNAVRDLKQKASTLKREQKLSQIYADLGKLFLLTGRYNHALKYYQKSLNLRSALGDQGGIASNYNFLGLIHKAYGDYDIAIEYYQKSLEINIALGELEGIAESYHNVGEIYQVRGDYYNALKNLEKSLKIRREIGDKAGEGATLNNISQISYTRGDYETALKSLEESLKIRREIGDKAGEGTTLNNISAIYHARGDDETTLYYLEQSLEIFQEIGDKKSEGTILNNISQIYHSRGDYETALNYLKRSLKIFQEIKDKSGSIPTLHNIAKIALEKKDIEKFLEYETAAYKIAIEIKDAMGIYNVGRTLGDLLCQRGRKKEGIEMLRRSIAVGKAAGFPDVEEIEEILKSLGQ